MPEALASDIAQSLDRARIAGVVVAVATTLVALPIEAAAIGSGWNDGLDPAVLRAVLLDTTVGHAWQVQTIAAFSLAATLALRPRWRLRATAALSALGLGALTLSGHAAMHEGWLGAAHRLNDGLHLLAGGAWLGALLPLLPILTALDHPRKRHDAGLALRRFSTAGHGAVALVIATGMLNTLLVLPESPLQWTTPYRRLLAAKILLVLVMTLLALVNRYVVVPRCTGDGASSVRTIRVVTLVEILLGAAVIGLVSVFGQLDPND